MFIKILLRDVF